MQKKSETSSSSEEDVGNSEYQVYCNLCKTAFAGTVPYRQHLKGSKHQKAEAKEFMKKKYGKQYLEAVAKMQKGTSDEKEKEPVMKIGDDDDALVIVCNICSKACTGQIPYELHMASKQHAKQVRKKQVLEKLNQDSSYQESNKKDDPLYEMVPQLKPFAECTVCKKSFSGPEGYDQHLASEIHKKEIQKQELVKSMESHGVVLNKSEDAEGGDDGACFATCADCGKAFSGPIPYQQHLQSDLHKNKGKERELTEKVKHMMVTDEEGSVQCAECGKVFSGPKPLYQHLLGPAHAKQKKRDDILKDLVRSYPEFVKDTSKSVMNGEDSDSDSDYLVCTICHKCFSGPESARDHFRSKKHLKAKKEKLRVEKLKKQKKMQASEAENHVGSVKNNTAALNEVDSTKQVNKRNNSVGDEFEIL